MTPKYDLADLKARNASGEIHENQLHPQLLQVLGLSPFPGCVSSARAQMMGSHVSQALVIEKPTVRKIQTGVENAYGKYTFNIKMPCDGIILSIIERYPAGLNYGQYHRNPETILIYEDAATKEIGHISLVGHCTHNDYFGFTYRKGEAMRHLRLGALIPKGSVFHETSSVDEHGNYRYGAQVNVAFMTHPAVAEDSILVSESLLKRYQYRTYETIRVEWGKSGIPLNLYGNDDEYRPFPDIGEYIRDDGVLMAVRSTKSCIGEETFNILSPVEYSNKALMEIDYLHDKTYYLSGPGGKVVDIIVHHDVRGKDLTGADSQAMKYHQSSRAFANRILEQYHKFKKKAGDSLVLTPQFHSLVTECMNIVYGEKGGGERIVRTYKNDPIDSFMVEIVVEYIKTPGIGSKLTDLFGG